MYDHIIEDMARALVDRGLVAAETQKEVESALADYWRPRVAFVWNTEDVTNMAPSLTEPQAVRVLTAWHRQHSCERDHVELERTIVAEFGVGVLGNDDGDADEK